jgi:hypothetical protein
MNDWRKSLALLTSAFVAVSVSTSSHAGFFIPKGTTMLMGTFSPDEQNYELAYGFDRRVSGALGVTRVKEGSESAPWRNIAMGQLTYLVDRRSTDDGIFNAYVWGGPIAERLDRSKASATERKHAPDQSSSTDADHRSRAGAQAGLWLDFETRRVYTRVKAHAFKSEGWRRNEVVAQAMLAPYAADYEDIASWGGLQVKRVSGEKTEVTPFVRFFQRNWWIDAGVSVDRTHRSNFFLNLIYTY